MVNTITGQTLKSPLAATDEFIINDVAGGNVDKKTTTDDISDYVVSAVTATKLSTMPVPNIPVIDAGVTSYVCPYSSADFATEANTGIMVAKAFTLTELRTKVSTNGITANTVITVRKNGSDTTSTVTYTSGSTTAQNDTTHTVAFAVGDILTISIVGGASGTTITHLKISLAISESVTLA